MKGTSNPQPISAKLEQIAELARKMPRAELRTLAHQIDIEWLREAFRRTRKDGAAGVDGRTAREYEENLKGSLRSLLDRAKSGSYKAPPVRRVYIPRRMASSRIASHDELRVVHGPLEAKPGSTGEYPVVAETHGHAAQ